jgi:hypothetical protein
MATDHPVINWGLQMQAAKGVIVHAYPKRLHGRMWRGDA